MPYPFNSEVTSVEELLKRADTAMYQAKGSGRNALCFFDPKMQSILEARVRIESWMRASIGEHFQLHYQPQVDSTGRVIGAEALLRWQHPEQGYISPATFIPLAEETGLILQIGEWVLREACSQLKQWNNDSRTSHMTIAVNVSAKQFKQADFVDLVLNTVFANVTPDYGRNGQCNGYFSVRRKPSKSGVDVMTDVYRAMLQEEEKAGPRDAMNASLGWLVNVLTQKGVSYEELVLSL